MRPEQPAPDDADDLRGRLARLIGAIEAQTNVLARLAQVLEGKKRRADENRRTRTRRAAVDAPITTTPMVRAAVKRALAKAGITE